MWISTLGQLQISNLNINKYANKNVNFAISHYQLQTGCFISELWFLCVATDGRLFHWVCGARRMCLYLRYKHVISGSRIPGKNTGSDTSGITCYLHTRLWKVSCPHISASDTHPSLPVTQDSDTGVCLTWVDWLRVRWMLRCMATGIWTKGRSWGLKGHYQKQALREGDQAQSPDVWSWPNTLTTTHVLGASDWRPHASGFTCKSGNVFALGQGCSHSAWALSQPQAPHPHRGIMQSPAPLDLPRGWLPGFQAPARRCVVDDDDVMTASCLLGLQQKAGRTPLSPQPGLEGFFPYRVHRRQDTGGPAAAMPTPLPTDAASGASRHSPSTADKGVSSACENTWQRGTSAIPARDAEKPWDRAVVPL